MTKKAGFITLNKNRHNFRHRIVSIGSSTRPLYYGFAANTNTHKGHVFVNRPRYLCMRDQQRYDDALTAMGGDPQDFNFCSCPVSTNICEHINNFKATMYMLIHTSYYPSVLENLRTAFNQNPELTAYIVVHVFNPLKHQGTTTIADHTYGSWTRSSKQGIDYIRHAFDGNSTPYEHPEVLNVLYDNDSALLGSLQILVVERFKHGDEHHILVEVRRTAKSIMTETLIQYIDWTSDNDRKFYVEDNNTP